MLTFIKRDIISAIYLFAVFCLQSDGHILEAFLWDFQRDLGTGIGNILLHDIECMKYGLLWLMIP